MFGGKWMDIFVDKLSQKLTAQEMIKANAAADAAELQKTKGQVAQYDALLKEIREINTVNAESAKQLNTLASEALKKLEDADKVNQLIDASLEKIREVKANDETAQQLEHQLSELKENVNNWQAQLAEHVHKENVKVYRNVQAVVVEESTKLGEAGTANAAAVKKVSGKVNAVMIISLVALLVSAASLAFQILAYLNIL